MVKSRKVRYRLGAQVEEPAGQQQPGVAGPLGQQEKDQRRHGEEAEELRREEGHGVTAFSKSRYYILADTAGKVNLPAYCGLPGGGR